MHTKSGATCGEKKRVNRHQLIRESTISSGNSAVSSTNRQKHYFIALPGENEVPPESYSKYLM
jgi:hypothetical protein